MPELPARQGDELLDLRPLSCLRDLQGHGAALVHSVPAAVGTVRALRRGQADPRRDLSAVLRDLHPARGVVLAFVPGLRAAAPAPLAFLRAVQPASTAERTARR